MVDPFNKKQDQKTPLFNWLLGLVLLFSIVTCLLSFVAVISVQNIEMYLYKQQSKNLRLQ